MIMDSPCIIIVSGARLHEKEAVHEVIKEHANGWWHHFADVWIVGGQTTGYWIENLSPVVAEGPSRLLIMALPENLGGRAYSGYMTDDEAEWITDQYLERSS
jgi:hypothetical protein